MVELADHDTRTHRDRAVEILRQIVADRSSLRSARTPVTDAPVVEQHNAPNVLVNPIGGNVLAALADDDRHFALIIEPLGATWIGNFFFRSGDLMGVFPKSPLAFVSGHLSYLHNIAGYAVTP